MCAYYLDTIMQENVFLKNVFKWFENDHRS